MSRPGSKCCSQLATVPSSPVVLTVASIRSKIQRRAVAISERIGRAVSFASRALAAGVFSAFFVNDTMCLALTPLVLEVTRATGRKPVPYLLAVAMASNAGSVATITGNPQNMMIGSFSHIPYREFAGALAPVALAGIVTLVRVLQDQKARWTLELLLC